MSLQSFMYLSEVAESFDREGVNGLSEFAKHRNIEFDITGYLYFNGHKFIQYIEGPAVAIFNLTNNIRRDPRHIVINELFLEPSDKRFFPEWSMRFLKQGDFGCAVSEKYLEQAITVFSTTNLQKKIALKIATSCLRMISSDHKILNPIRGIK